MDEHLSNAGTAVRGVWGDLATLHELGLEFVDVSFCAPLVHLFDAHTWATNEVLDSRCDAVIGLLFLRRAVGLPLDDSIFGAAERLMFTGRDPCSVATARAAIKADLRDLFDFGGSEK